MNLCLLADICRPLLFFSLGWGESFNTRHCREARQV